MVLSHLPETSATSIQCVEMTAKRLGYSHYMDFDDYMHGGVSLYDTLECLFHDLRLDNKEWDSIVWRSFLPSVHGKSWADREDD
jgi:hypothetical protein